MTTQANQILVVEDRRFLRRARGVSLRHRGWPGRIAVDGEEAFAITRMETADRILRQMLMPKLHGA
jgi:DNA-binding response OmpR family regulator